MKTNYYIVYDLGGFPNAFRGQTLLKRLLDSVDFDKDNVLLLGNVMNIEQFEHHPETLHDFRLKLYAPEGYKFAENVESHINRYRDDMIDCEITPTDKLLTEHWVNICKEMIATTERMSALMVRELTEIEKIRKRKEIQ